MEGISRWGDALSFYFQIQTDFSFKIKMAPPPNTKKYMHIVNIQDNTERGKELKMTNNPFTFYLHVYSFRLFFLCIFTHIFLI